MDEVKGEGRLRKEIAERVEEIFRLRSSGRGFTAGKDKVHYAGRVFDEEEMKAAVDSSIDFWLTLGKEGKEFSKEFSKFIGLSHCLLVNSGSSANLLAIGALCSQRRKNPIRPGDEIITTALAFPTTLAPILQYGLVPVFVDVDPYTYNIDTDALKNALSSRTRAIAFAHTLGNPADMGKIMDIAKENDLEIIEDTCDALGARYGGRMCGTFGTFSTFSFYAAHHITMGEGGALCTDDNELYRIAMSLRDWGRACYCETGEGNKDGACRNRFGFNFAGMPKGYDHKYTYIDIGYNLKPMDIGCAIGRKQLMKLSGFIRSRNENFRSLYEHLNRYEKELILPKTAEGAEPSWFAFPITISGNAAFSRGEIVGFLEARGIETRMLFSGNILRHPGFAGIKKRISGTLLNSDRILERSFFIGVYPGIDEKRLEHVKSAFDEFFNGR